MTYLLAFLLLLQTAPAAPSNLRPGLITSTSVDVFWDDNATDETRHELLYGVLGTTGTNVQLPADLTLWTAEGLIPDTDYFFRIRACNLSGCSSTPPALLVRTQPAPINTPTPEPTPTDTPTPLPTSTSTATETPTPTNTPEPTATETPTPEPTATSTAASCPGVHVGVVVAENTLTWTCVKPTDIPWPDAVEFREWRAAP